MRERRRLAFALLFAVLGGCAGSPPPEMPVPEVEEPPVQEVRPVTSEAERTLSRGLVAAKEGDYRAARRALMRVAGSCPGTPPGVEALVALLSVELDPRNPDRDPLVARNLAQAYLSLPVKPAWTAPTVETLYLMSLDVVEAAEAVREYRAGDSSADSSAGAAGADSTVAQDSTVPAAARGGMHGDTAGPTGGARSPAADPSEGAGAARADDGPGSGGGTTAPPGPILSCAVTGPSPSVGAMPAPVAPGPSVGDRLRAVETQRDTLQATVARLERELRELRQELERIRETLEP